jgi:hypothetical protein
MSKIYYLKEMDKIDLKHKLYSLLLHYPIDKLTDEEIDIMYALSKDRDIQDTLERAKNEKR